MNRGFWLKENKLLSHFRKYRYADNSRRKNESIEDLIYDLTIKEYT